MRDDKSKKSKVFVSSNSSPSSWIIFRWTVCIQNPFALFFAPMKLSWSKKMVRKWFNIKSKTEEFQADVSAPQGIKFLIPFSGLFKTFLVLFWRAFNCNLLSLLRKKQTNIPNSLYLFSFWVYSLFNYPSLWRLKSLQLDCCD